MSLNGLMELYLLGAQTMRGYGVLLLLAVLAILGSIPVGASYINPATTLRCHVRKYTFSVNKPPLRDALGRTVVCNGEVRVDSCWGRCDSSEIGDFKMPFKVSNHPVCTYTGRVQRTVDLTGPLCPRSYGKPKDRLVTVFDAAGCACSRCDSDSTSCENLNG